MESVTRAASLNRARAAGSFPGSSWMKPKNIGPSRMPTSAQTSGSDIQSSEFTNPEVVPRSRSSRVTEKASSQGSRMIIDKRYNAFDPQARLTGH